MISKIKELWNKYKKLLLYILIPLVIGFIGNLLGGNMDIYKTIKTPSFAPPSWLFGVVWPILYILMGISSYIISKKENNSNAFKVYFFQLALNALWSLVFFRLKLFALSTVWLAVIVLLVALMIYEFYKLDKKAGLLQIPYLCWLGFAFILNYSIYLLN